MFKYPEIVLSHICDLFAIKKEKKDEHLNGLSILSGAVHC